MGNDLKSQRGGVQINQGVEQRSKRKYEMKIVIRGDQYTGKSCLLDKLLGKKFVEAYTPNDVTVVRNFEFKTEMRDVVDIQVWDVLDRVVQEKKNGLPELKTTGFSKKKEVRSVKIEYVLPPEYDTGDIDENYQVVMDRCDSVIIMIDPTRIETWYYAKAVLQDLPKDMHVLVMMNYRDFNPDSYKVRVSEVRHFCHIVGQKITVVESSMRYGFGLKELKTFLYLPFLSIQEKLIDDAIITNEEELDVSVHEFELFSSAHTFEEYMSKNRKKADVEKVPIIKVPETPASVPEIEESSGGDEIEIEIDDEGTKLAAELAALMQGDSSSSEETEVVQNRHGNTLTRPRYNNSLSRTHGKSNSLPRPREAKPENPKVVMYAVDDSDELPSKGLTGKYVIEDSDDFPLESSEPSNKTNRYVIDDSDDFPLESSEPVKTSSKYVIEDSGDLPSDFSVPSKTNKYVIDDSDELPSNITEPLNKTNKYVIEDSDDFPLESSGPSDKTNRYVIDDSDELSLSHSMEKKPPNNLEDSSDLPSSSQDHVPTQKMNLENSGEYPDDQMVNLPSEDNINQSEIEEDITDEKTQNEILHPEMEYENELSSRDPDDVVEELKMMRELTKAGALDSLDFNDFVPEGDLDDFFSDSGDDQFKNDNQESSEDEKPKKKSQYLLSDEELSF
eukprot:TRINITY_DN1928_c0_g1_i1.p1 TRINITY_DN1928_c0_g1~~TRINITY_DN1928_c0_g1_i1.p1  ORF type:complete len:673 (+),score=196.63 TRINITY_DN1928_c0_g1_i1:36-2054(+)